jgi:hypothetical protein
MRKTVNPYRHSPVVALLGGMLEPGAKVGFAQCLGRSLQAQTRFRFCVSGFKGKRAESGEFRPSFGYAVASSAAAGSQPQDIQSRFMTRYSEFDPTDETQYQLGDTRQARGRNKVARGLSIIADSDVVCLGAGGNGTREYFQFALAMDKPVLPLPCCGGSSAELWASHSARLIADFGEELDALDQVRQLETAATDPESIDAVAAACVEALHACTRLRCLVFMPFSSQFRWIFERIIVPACDSVSADAIRLDYHTRIGDITATFESELHRADCVIAVISKESSNVFYEIGYAHASQIPVILLAEDSASATPEQDLTFYLRNHRTVWYLPQANERGEALASGELSKLL